MGAKYSSAMEPQSRSMPEKAASEMKQSRQGEEGRMSTECNGGCSEKASKP